MRSLTWREVWGRRLARSHLLERADAARLVEVAGDACGIHAQVMTAAELSLGARVDGIRRDDVKAELVERRGLVKIASLRTTLHLHPADEIPIWLAARGSERWDDTWWFKSSGLTREQGEQLGRAVANALDGVVLTREELRAEVVRRLGAWAGEETPVVQFGTRTEAWKLFVGAAAPVCYGPPRGNRITLTRADRWLESWRDVATDEARREIARRYLRTYGPATADEFAHWFGAHDLDAAALFAELGDELEEMDVEGRRALALAGDDWPDAEPAGVRLLPYYDCYVVGCHPRDVFIPDERKRIFDRGAGPTPALVVDGVVRGTWTREQRGKKVELRVEPFRRLTKAQRAELDQEGRRIGAFLGLEPTLEIA